MGEGANLPFPQSLCHRCAAPARYVPTATSVFILCPLLPNKYPPQPVRACSLFVPKAGSSDGGGTSGDGGE
jgi:hypothetical protein